MSQLIESSPTISFLDFRAEIDNPTVDGKEQNLWGKDYTDGLGANAKCF